MRLLALALLLSSATAGLSQSVGDAQSVYASAQDSVFLVYLNDSSGSPSALGSAFLVAPRTLITNAHVVEAGSPVLAVGPVRIPLKVLRIDQKNDLALLSVDADLTSKPLNLASEKLNPGEQIFAIGNPEGLEKTISQGIVSGLRTRGTRNLIQITSAISHGSSGGPILDAKGDVVAVAVGMFEDGQNLNFAVPVEYVRALLNQSSPASANSALEPSGNLEDARELLSKWQQDKYSNDPSSEYQQDTEQLTNLVRALEASTNNEKDLGEIACFGTKAINLSSFGISAARKLVQLRPSPENQALLSYTLYDRAQDEALNVAFANKDSDEMTAAVAAHEKFLNESSSEASIVPSDEKGHRLPVATYVLASVKDARKDYTGAIALNSLVVRDKVSICDYDLTLAAYENLVDESDKAQLFSDAEKWFRLYASHYAPTAYQWDAEGDRRHKVKDYETAARSYEMAADLSNLYSYDYCYASADNYFRPATNEDGVLSDGKKCVEQSVKADKDNKKFFTEELPIVYRSMAIVLETRGVYDQALEYIQDAISAKPDDWVALNTEANIFSDLNRNTECIAAEKQAIRLSDGKYPSMQFRLGNCYFASENWAQAAQSFQISANADKADAASAYNLGLSLSRQGFGADAQIWYSEALKRKPVEELRAKILAAMR